MTISSTTNRLSYSGNGATVAFSVSFKFIDPEDIVVYVDDTLQVLDTDYSVTGGAGSTGTVTFDTAPAAATTIVILRDVAILQETDYAENDNFPAETHERALDRLTMIAQRLKDRVDRSFTLSDSDTSGASLGLPSPEAGAIVGWNPTADALQNYDQSTFATLVAYGTAQADLFDGTGAQTDFTLTANPGSQNNLDVSISGVTQTPGVDYNWSAGTTISFVVAPPAGTDNVLVRYMQGLANTNAQDAAYTPAGTGAVETTIKEKLRESVSVSDFGGDLQAAIDAVSAAGGGVVTLDADVTVSSISMKSLVEVVGNAGTYVGSSSAAAVGKRVITITGAGTGVAFGNGTTGIYGAALRNVEVYTTTGADGIVLNGGPSSATVSCEIENVRCNGFSAAGIASKGHAFTNRIVRSGGANCDIGIDLQEEANNTVIDDPQCSANRVNIRIGDGSGVSQDSIVVIGGNNDSATEEGILIQAPTVSVSIIAPYIEGSGKEPIKSSATSATLTIQGGKLIGPSASYDNINLAAACIFDISGVTFGGSCRYDINISAAASYYGSVGPCRHGSTAASGRIGNSATGDSTLDLFDSYLPQRQLVGTFGTHNSFNPTIIGTSTAGTATYGAGGQIGRYVKIGKLVHAWIYLNWTAHTGTGDLRISGLPFAVKTDGWFPAAVRNGGVAITAGNVLQAYTGAGLSVVVLEQYTPSTGSPSAIPMDTVGSLMLELTYETD